MSLSTADPVVKVPWDGTLVSVQPRIRLNRSFDQRSHVYLGYAFRVRGTVGNAEREFIVGVGEGAHAKHQFRAGDRISGEALPVADPRLETVKFYKVSNLRVYRDEAVEEVAPAPWRGIAPSLSVYRGRGHRRLAARTYEKSVHTVYLGMPHGGGNDHRPLESQQAPLSYRNILLWASFLFPLSVGSAAQGAWPSWDELLGGRLD